VRILFALALAACDPPPATLSTDAVSAGEAQDLCLDYCEDAVECHFDGTEGECESECFDLSDALRGDVFRVVLTCLDEQHCFDDDPSVCTARAHNAFEPLDFHEEAAATCAAALTACGTDPAPCDASRLEFLSEAAAAEIARCAEGACGDIPLCVDAILAAVALP